MPFWVVHLKLQYWVILRLSICFHIQFPIHAWQLMAIPLKAEIKPIGQRLLYKEARVQILSDAGPFRLPFTHTCEHMVIRNVDTRTTLLPNTPSVMWHWHPEQVHGERLPDSKSPFPRMLPSTRPVSRVSSIHIIVYVLLCTSTLINRDILMMGYQSQNHTFKIIPSR